MRFRPLHAIVALGIVIAAVVLLERTLEGSTRFEKVMPAADRTVRVPLDGLDAGEIRFYRFLNRSNQEVQFFVARDAAGTLQVALNASESDYKRKRGFRLEGEWIVNNKCETAVRLVEVNAGSGGCRPVPLEHRVEGDSLVIAETDILSGWRLFV